MVELEVVRLVEFPQFLNELRVDFRMRSAFGFAQTVGFATAFWLFEAREALGLVEVEVFICDDPLQAEEVLHSAQLARRVAYHPLTVDKVDLRERKVGQPSLQVSGVQADVQRAPERVYQSRGSVLERQALEAGDAGRLGDDLGVV